MFRVGLITLVVFVVTPGLGDSSTVVDTCCRSPEDTIYYKTKIFDHFYSANADLFRVETLQGRLSVTIKGAPLRGEAESCGAESLLTTTDLGKTWKCTLLELPVNLSGAYATFLEAPSDSRVIYKWLQQIGLYLRSEDHGSTWILPHYSVDGVSYEEFAFRVTGKRFYRLDFRLATIHPRQPLTLYAGIEAVPWSERVSDEDQFRPYRLPGLYVSYDGGETWKKFTDALRSFIPPPYAMSPLGISPSNPNVMYGDAMDGVIKSTDGGRHWTAVGQQAAIAMRPARLLGSQKVLVHPTDPRGLDVAQIVVDPTDRSVVYVLSNKGVYRTEDGGKSWCLLDLGFDVLDAYNALALSPINPNTLFVGTTFGLFYSKDRGCHFKRIYPSNPQK